MKTASVSVPATLALPPVQISGNTMSVRFDRFDIAAYQRFLQVKRIPEFSLDFDAETESYTITAPKRFAAILGETLSDDVVELELSPHLFDDQRAIIGLALDAKRYACWSDCGLGKTLIGLEFARQVANRTGGRVLIVTMNEIVGQWAAESEKFYGDSLPITRLRSRAEMKAWADGGPGHELAVTNYEKFNPDEDGQVVNECRNLAGVVLDESSRLKTGGGKQKWALIKSCKGIEYKLSLTATPAPNDTMEFASQASFLERMRSESEIIWTYFQRHPVTHRWTVKKHARKAFFEFMAAWSIYVRDPRKYGWRLDHQDIPMPEIFCHQLSMNRDQATEMQKLTIDKLGQLAMFQSDAASTIQRGKMSQIAKGFRYLKGESGRSVKRINSAKPDFVAKLIRDEAGAGLSVLVWTVFDAEGVILSEKLAAGGVDHSLISGDTADDDRTEILDRFQSEKCRVLISKASMLGFGLNFQHVGSMVFSGWNDSFEAYYQALRRAYRYGQTKKLRVHIPVIADLEGDMLETIFEKEAKHLAAIEEMEANYVNAMKGLVLVK